LLVGKPPFNGANHMQLLRNIERNEARLPDHIAARLSGPCKSLLGRLLQRNPVERLTFEEFFQHPFLAGEPGEQLGTQLADTISLVITCIAL
jgi:serine/threonine-protein kinase ULK/ATG1